MTLTPCEDTDTPFGECSPTAIGAIMHASPRTRFLHVVRNPIDAVSSMLYTGHVTWQEGTPPLTPFPKARPWEREYKRRTDHYGQWPADRVQRALEFWRRYNLEIERAIKAQGRHPYRRIQVESPRPDVLFALLKDIGVNVSPERIRYVVDNTGRQINSFRKRPRGEVDWELTEEQRVLAERYGYETGSID